jgi:hypothetical protein
VVDIRQSLGASMPMPAYTARPAVDALVVHNRPVLDACSPVRTRPSLRLTSLQCTTDSCLVPSCRCKPAHALMP